MPTATDLVTDLPADFEVFGQAVATSMADLLGGTSGQVLAKNSNTDMDFVWVTSDDANAIQNAIVDAKGDLIAASAADTPARLAVGANDTMLVGDSTAATGLSYKSSATLYPWSTWTPTIAGATVGNSTIVARFQRIGKTVHLSFGFTLGSTGSITGRFNFSMPSSSTHIRPCSVYMNLSGASFATPAFGLLGISGNLLYTDAIFTNATYATGGATSSTAPFTWTTGSEIVVFATYEEA
jgi:hypothetical protein